MTLICAEAVRGDAAEGGKEKRKGAFFVFVSFAGFFCAKATALLASSIPFKADREALRRQALWHQTPHAVQLAGWQEDELYPYMVM